MINAFEKNIIALGKKDPILGAKLRLVQPNEFFEVYHDNDPANINIIDKRTNKPLYTARPVDETLNKIDAFVEYAYYPYLYFYGIGNGIFYKLLLSNETLRRVIVIEPDPEILFIALNFVDFSDEIESGRLVFTLSANLTNAKAIEYISFDDARIYGRLYDMHLLSPYYTDYTEDYIRVNRLFVNAIEHAVISAGNDSKDALLGLEHHVQNLPEMLESPYLTEFITRAATTDTAIIVSTGPSLYKQLSLLKELAPYVTIFCIDASFPILHAHGIKPDVVLSLERVKESAKFYQETPKEAQEGVIFAITSIVHENLKNAITRGIKQYSMRPFGYNRLFDLQHYGYLGIGMSAANMAYELIVHARFKRCVFIGQDLAFGDDGTSHSKGAVYGEGEIKPSSSQTDRILLERYGGGGSVESTMIWRIFLNFFERDIADTPYNLEVINCTEGGARIHGAQEMSFVELSKLIDKTKVKSKIKITKPSDEDIKLNTEQVKNKILELLEFGYEKKHKVEEVFLSTVKMTEELERLNKEQRLEEIDFSAIGKLLGEIDEVKGYFQESLFSYAFLDAVQSYIIHQELEIAKIVVRYTSSDMDKKVKQIDWLYAHKYWLFSLAGGMNAVLEIVKRSAREWMEIPARFDEVENKGEGNAQESGA